MLKWVMSADPCFADADPPENADIIDVVGRPPIGYPRPSPAVVFASLFGHPCPGAGKNSFKGVSVVAFAFRNAGRQC